MKKEFNHKISQYMLKIWSFIKIAFFLFLCLTVNPHLSLSADIIIGDKFVYTIQKGDNLSLISARLGASFEKILKDNNLDSKKNLKIGQQILVDTRKIVPLKIDDGIIVNIPDKTLYYFENGSIKMSFPVGLGMPSWRGKTTWRTPLGKFRITGKRQNPVWRVPPSISKKMAIEGKHVEGIVLPGPDNPLGKYALDTTIPSIVIHETIWPTSIYQFRSHGCIRVHPDNMENFFKMVRTNTQGELIYKPIKIAAIDNKRIFLEVHKDIYGYSKDLLGIAKQLIEEKGLNKLVDWEKVERVVNEKAGVPEDISL